MNDMRDLENGFKREPLGVGVGDSLPEPDDREALAEHVAAHACAERHNGRRVGTAMDRLRVAFKDGAAWQRWRHPEPVKPSRDDVAAAIRKRHWDMGSGVETIGVDDYEAADAAIAYFMELEARAKRIERGES